MEVGRIVEILCEHRHQRLSADDIEVVPDLQILNLYAARVAGESDYLVHTDDGAVEEVAFEGWPPLPPRAVQSASSDKRRRNGMRIEQLMSRQVQYCRPDETLDRAARLMWNHDCGCVPVCTGDGAPQVIGMVTDRDICMSALFQGKPLRELTVSEAMSGNVRTCHAADMPAEVENVMRTEQIRRVPVTDERGILLGIVSLADLAREAEKQDASASQEITETEIGDTLAAICTPSRSRSGATGARA